MTTGNEQVVEALRTSLVELERVREVNRQLLTRSEEPVAIVGMSCRYPGGVASPRELWELVESGSDAIGEFPQDRGWDVERLFDPDPESAGTSYTRHGGFLRDAGDFDAEFFGIGPHEALAMDPQQRLLLEGAWEVLEDAGIPPASLIGSRIGVFVGVTSSAYGVGLDLPEIEGLRLTGTTTSVASGRLAYFLGLEGPTVTVDTACSSSLVALHLACQALRSDECSLALAGGATVLTNPTLFVEFSRQRGLSVDGRCKSFGAEADGTGWSEGMGLLLLERLSDAKRNGHEVLAVVRGSAVNQDGASNGLTAPNGPSQQRVIRDALAGAGLSASDVDVVEAHGTGTRLGDPIEAQALLETYGRGRPDGRPLWLGSVKSNIGHSIAAAGVAGVIKMVQALRHGVLPKTLHADERSPHVDWSEGDVELLTEQVTWERNGAPRRAGVSSFGISGTNAHMILEEAPAVENATAAAAAVGGGSLSVVGGGVLPFLVSGSSAGGLVGQAGRLRGFVEGDVGLGLAGVGGALALRRGSLSHRGVVVAGDRGELLDGLGALERGALGEGVVSGVAGGGGVAFLFSGQGSQWAGMGRGLYERFPVFAGELDVVCEEFDGLLGRSLQDLLFAEGGSEGALLLDRTEFTQPALFALEVALYRLVVSFGVRPDYLVGHSIGELAAAYVAGVSSLEDACALVAARGRLMGALADGGAMAAVMASESEVLESLSAFPGRLALAAVNGPGSVVVSGDEGALGEWEGSFAEGEGGGGGWKVTRLRVSHAFHSPLMDPMLEEFRGVVRDLSLSEPRIPIVSNVSGVELSVAEATSAEYWASQVRGTVRFADGVSFLRDRGVTRFLEVGPDGVLSGLAHECLQGPDSEGGDAEGGVGEGSGGVLVAASSRRGHPEDRAFLGFLARAHVDGVDVDWSAFFDEESARGVALPTYAFQRRRYWLAPRGGVGDAGTLGLSPTGHPLLGAVLRLAGEGDGWLFTGRLSLEDQPWLRDHAVMGSVLMPGTGFVELALAAGQHVGAEVLEELTLQAPLLLDADALVSLQVTVSEPDPDGKRDLTIHSSHQGEQAEPGSADWTLHAAGTLRHDTTQQQPDDTPLTSGEWPPAGAQELDSQSFYDQLTDAGYNYGPAFQGLRSAFAVGDEIYAEVALAEENANEAQSFCVYPALSDASLHAALLSPGLESEVRVPFSFTDVRLYGRGAGAVRVCLAAEDDSGTLSVTAVDAQGDPVFSVGALHTRTVDQGQLATAQDSGQDSLYELEWVEQAEPSVDGSRPELVVVGDGKTLLPALGAQAEEVQSYPHVSALLNAIENGSGAPEVLLLAAPAARRLRAADGTPADVEQEDRLDLAQTVHRTTGLLLSSLQELLAAESLQETRVLLVTDRASRVVEGEAPNLAQAALVGLWRSAQSEHPGRLGAIDLGEGEVAAEMIHRALGIEEPEVAIREDALYARRLARVQVRDDVASPRFDPQGTVLITGGMGGLGAVVARHLVVEHGAESLLLVSRSGREASGAGELLDALGELGCEVQVLACDVADRVQVQRLLAAVPAERPLSMVVHAAGVLDDGLIESLDGERLSRVLAPKVDAAINLHELTKELDLRELVLFSSAAASIGSPGQGNYAAANAFLDALSFHRRAEGLCGLSLAWGPWDQAGGMAGVLSGTDRARLERAGIVPLSEERGLELFDSSRGTGRPLLLPMPLEMAALRSQAKAGMLPAVLRGLVRVPIRQASDAGGSLARQLAGAPESEWQEIVSALVSTHVAGVLGHSSAGAIDPQRAFKDLGLDSLAAVELRNRLSVATGLKLPSTLVFDHPTPAAVSAYVRSKVEGRQNEVKTRRRVSARTDEPIAIVGMSCRYPGGVASPAELWDLVASGTDAISEFPTNRGWDLESLFDPDPDHSGTSYTRHGGFVHDAGDFDAGFFGIGPREALAMDPQQRLLLEGAWEAFEDAGIPPGSLAGSRTGVFTGLMYQEYGTNVGSVSGEVEGYLGTGNAGSVVSGRLAYNFGFEGPAMTVDTACSSSLVTMHLACQALRSDECSLALAGGVTILVSPGVYVVFSRQRGLSVDGRCKSFGAAADGTGWAEGMGLLLLERLSDAERNGHEVLAVVRGSAVNQDGASNGLTAPNGPSQERVIRQALANAGLSSAEVDVVEAHGTGTPLGDPIEAQALLATYGQGRPEGHPLRLGSMKSNIGHTQAAAGVAGVIKMVQAMRHGMLPKTLHADERSPHVDWSEGEVELLTESMPWERNGAPRRASVSSFGISGTNAHVILEEAPVKDKAPRAAVDGVGAGRGDGDALLDGRGALPFLVSASSGAALAGQAGRLRAFVEGDRDMALVDVGSALASRRSALSHRAVVVAREREGLVASLGALERGDVDDGLVTGMAGGEGKVAFLFSGQGSQWVGMGAELWDSSAVFAAQMRACTEAFAAYFEWSLEDVLRGVDGAPSLERVDVVQPALFAVMVSLAALWRSCGVEPSVVLGHSQGEIAAAYVAGGLSLGDAVRVVALRSKALAEELSGRGGMVSVSLAADRVEGDLARWGERVSLAVVNGPASVVVSGEPEALEELLAYYESEGVRARGIPVDYASHSAQIESIEQRLLAELSSIAPRAGEIPFYSATTGTLFDTVGLDGSYWYSNLRQTVHFYEATRALLQDSVTTFIEMSPHPVLTVAVEETIEAEGADPGAVSAIGSLRREQGSLARFLTSLSQAHVEGIDIDWSSLFKNEQPQHVALPTYAFQRERFWLEDAGGPVDAGSLGLSSGGHPLLRAATVLAGDDESWLFTGRISLESHPWLKDHAVMNSVLMPGLGIVELALAAGERIGTGIVEELMLERPLLLGGRGGVQLQVSVGEADEDGRRSIGVYSRAENVRGDEELELEGWVRHATGTLAQGEASHATRLEGFDAWPPPGAQKLETEFLYDRLAEAGYDYGPVFQNLRRAFRIGDDLFAEVALDEEQLNEAQDFCLHPALSDAALHAVLLEALDGPQNGEVEVPFAFSGVHLLARGASTLRVRLSRDGAGTVSLSAVDEQGVPVFSVQGMQTRAIDQSQLNVIAREPRNDSLFEVHWVEQQPAASDGAQPRRVAALDGLPVDGLQKEDGGRATSTAARLDAISLLFSTGATTERYPDLRALEDALEQGAQAPELVLLDADTLSDPAEDGKGESLTASVHLVTARLLELLQAWTASEWLTQAKLVLLTNNAVAVAEGEAPNLNHAALVGLMRSAQSEHPGRISLIDLDDDPGSREALAGALGADEPELALRKGAVHVPRLTRLGAGGSLVPPSGETAWSLMTLSPGSLESVVLGPRPRVLDALAPGQVRVAVRAAGLNFRDLLVALGVVKLPGEASLGAEGAGVVLEVAPDVSDLAVGDHVMGLLVDAFGTVALSDTKSLVKMPEGWSFSQAASVPVVFLTAWYGLIDLAQLKRGERLLLHGAAGGVGIATLQLAAHWGVEVFATAHPDKWGTLKELGLDEAHISSSRTLEFKDKFLGSTEGEGMDVVLDSLAGEFVDASLELLPRGGRFIEMGKTDIRAADEVTARYAGVHYRAFDLQEAGPERVQEMLKEVVELFQQGALNHLPISVTDIRRAPDAFRFLRESRHIGKLVLSSPRSFDPHGTVLITGGTGGLGALVARHLATDHGAKRLLLVSRSGLEAEGAEELSSALHELGCDARIVACDAADRGALKELIDAIPVEHPLTMVVHAAGVLDDGLIESLDGERLSKVLTPKVDAAVNLHELTKGEPLCEFVLFSSVASTLGSPGQANYAAANSFLDALAARRRAEGLPGVSLGWGAWERATGMTAALSGADRARFERVGIAPISDRDGLELFDVARGVDEPLLLPAPLDMSFLRDQAKTGMLPAILRGLVRAPTRRASGAKGSLAGKLAESPESEWAGIIEELVSTHVAGVLGHASPAAIDAQRAFKELGFDSLAAVEFRNRLGHVTGLNLPSTLVFDHPTPLAVAEYVRSMVSDDQAVRYPIDEQLDQLEMALSAVAEDLEERARTKARLQALTRRMQAFLTDDDDDGGVAASAEVQDALEAATDDELFALIDERRDSLGHSEGGSR